MNVCKNDMPACMRVIFKKSLFFIYFATHFIKQYANKVYVFIYLFFSFCLTILMILLKFFKFVVAISARMQFLQPRALLPCTDVLYRE